jgi:X-X-X-Leu-X-X-Gly heptad repeat protein
MLRIAGLPVWVGPSDVVTGARAVMGWTEEAVEVVASLPERASTLLDDVEALVARIATVADRVEGIADRADVIVGSVDEVLVGVRTAVTSVDAVLADADGLVRRVDPLLIEVRTAAGGAAELVTRAAGVAEEAAGLVARASTVADGAAELVAGAVTVADGAGAVMEKATVVADRAGTVVEQASGAADGATELLAVYQPIARQAAPLARRFVEEFSEEEVHAAIRLVDQLPQLTEHMENDIMPILATLDRVGPDVHELLDQLKEMRQAIQGIPGLGFFRRRGEREDAEENGGNGR